MSARFVSRSLFVSVLALALASVPAIVQNQARGQFPGENPPDGPPPQGVRPPGPRGPGAGRPEGPGPLMEALDTDRDGELSAEEIRKAPESLRKLDRDRDGRIDRMEARPRFAVRGGNGQPPRRGLNRPGRPGPGGPDRPPGPPDGPGGPGGMGRPPEVGDVVPPFVRADLRLDREQERKLAALESEVRKRLAAILDREQMRDFEEGLRRGPGGPPPGGPPEGPGGAPGDDGPPIRPGRPDER